MTAAQFEWAGWFARGESRGIDDQVPWFFVEEPTPMQGAVWCCALYAAGVALAVDVGLSPCDLRRLVIASAAALACVHPEATAREEVDYVVGAAACLLAELLPGGGTLRHVEGGGR